MLAYMCKHQKFMIRGTNRNLPTSTPPFLLLISSEASSLCGISIIIITNTTTTINIILFSFYFFKFLLFYFQNFINVLQLLDYHQQHAQHSQTLLTYAVSAFYGSMSVHAAVERERVLYCEPQSLPYVCPGSDPSLWAVMRGVVVENDEDNKNNTIISNI